MKDDRHTSKSKLSLFDGLMRKPGKVPVEPDIGKQCEGDGKKCATKQKSTFQQAMGEYPGPIRNFGPKQAQILKQFRTSAVAYGLATVLATFYFCEWKLVLQYLPYYNGKYKTDD